MEQTDVEDFNYKLHLQMCFKSIVIVSDCKWKAFIHLNTTMAYGTDVSLWNPNIIPGVL